MSTSNVNVMSDAIANAVKTPVAMTCEFCNTALTAAEIKAQQDTGEEVLGICDTCANATQEQPKPAPVMDLAKFQAELARLKAEKAQILAAKNAPKPAPVVAAAVPPPANATAADAKLLEIIAKFISKPRADGKPSGTFAVKVHSYFHACGIDEMKTREIIASAEKRNVISKMSIPTKNGNRMMLYFDARVRPANSFTGTGVTSAEKGSVLAAFGL